MRTRRRFVAVAGALALAGCGSDGQTESPGADGDRDGTEADTVRDTGTGGGLAFSSPAFEDGGAIPETYTGVGDDVSPPLEVESVPSGAETLALVVDDPDANRFVHWLLWNVPADTESVPEGLPQTESVAALAGARQGTNDFGELGYRGPLPPADDGPHRYRFELSALETALDLPAGSSRAELADALDGSVLDTRTIAGTFDREQPERFGDGPPTGRGLTRSRGAPRAARSRRPSRCTPP